MRDAAPVQDDSVCTRPNRLAHATDQRRFVDCRLQMVCASIEAAFSMVHCASAAVPDLSALSARLPVVPVEHALAPALLGIRLRRVPSPSHVLELAIAVVLSSFGN